MTYYKLNRETAKTKRHEIYSRRARTILDILLRDGRDRLSADEVVKMLEAAGYKLGNDTLAGFRSMCSKCFFVLGVIEREGAASPASRKAAPAVDEATIRKMVDEAVAKLAESLKSRDVAAADRAMVEALVNSKVEPAIDRAQRLMDAAADTPERIRQAVADAVAERMNRVKPVLVEVKDVAGKVKAMGTQHQQFPLLLQTVGARTQSGNRLNVWLTGPAGTGKTTGAQKAAEALGLKFYFTGALDNPYGLLGFVDATGKVVRTQFRDAYENGGVFLFDEVDASAPSAVLALNAAIANGHCAFPDKVVARHKDFCCVAAANTWGLGATNDYVGRMKQDAAFLDRFVQIEWNEDAALEYAIAGNDAWVERVQKVRARVRELGLKVVISPRASQFGASLLAAGVPQAAVEAMTLRKAMTPEQWAAVNR